MLAPLRFEMIHGHFRSYLFCNWFTCNCILFVQLYSKEEKGLKSQCCKVLLMEVFCSIEQGINSRATEMQDTAKSFSSMAEQVLRTEQHRQS